MPVDDLLVIEKNIDYFNSLLPLKIVSANFVVEEDEREVEYGNGATMFDWKEVVLEMTNYNNFWVLTKFVQQFKMESL